MRPELDPLEDHLGIGAQVQLDLVADRDVFDRLLREIGEPVAAIVAEDADHAIRQWRRAELRVLVVREQVHSDELLAIFLRAVAVLDLERHGRGVERPHSLRPAVLDRLGPFDRVDEVFAEALFDDLLFLWWPVAICPPPILPVGR